jgi:hypothetical protein
LTEEIYLLYVCEYALNARPLQFVIAILYYSFLYGF